MGAQTPPAPARDQTAYRRLVGLLEEHAVPYRLIDHEPEGGTAAASRLRGHSLAEAAKSIVVRVTVDKKRSAYALAVVPGDREVDLQRVTRLLDGSRAGFAVLEQAERLTGSVRGAVVPFSFDPRLSLIVDPGLLEQERIFFNAGRLDRSVGLATSDYLALSQPRLAPIARRHRTLWAPDPVRSLPSEGRS